MILNFDGQFRHPRDTFLALPSQEGGGDGGGSSGGGLNPTLGLLGGGALALGGSIFSGLLGRSSGNKVANAIHLAAIRAQNTALFQSSQLNQARAQLTG